MSISSADTPQLITLSEIMPNPKMQGVNEWIEIANGASTPADLTGWAIDDADGGGSPYHLPQGSVIAPRSLLVISLPKALFNNSGDTVRLLRPDGSVADQYIYTQSSADQRFCRVEHGWQVCASSPNALNQAAPTPSTPMAGTPIPVTQTPNQAPSLHVQAIANHATPTLPAWSQGSITAAPAYSNATAGARYRGAASATPISTFSTPTQALRATQRVDAPPISRSTRLPLAMYIGIFLFGVGSVISGYDWLRTRRMPAFLAPAEDMPLELLDRELLEDDSPEDELDR
jgi:hypothetical protein